MREREVLRLLKLRAESCNVSSIEHTKGSVYRVIWEGREYRAVVLVNSFDYYAKRYHITLSPPNLIICYRHDTFVPIPVLALALGTLAIEPDDYPEGITNENLERLRHKSSKVASQVLIGLYINGRKAGLDRMHSLKYATNGKGKRYVTSTYRRYLTRIEQLSKRKCGRPVGKMSDTATVRKKSKNRLS